MLKVHAVFLTQALRGTLRPLHSAAGQPVNALMRADNAPAGGIKDRKQAEWSLMSATPEHRSYSGGRGRGLLERGKRRAD